MTPAFVFLRGVWGTAASREFDPPWEETREGAILFLNGSLEGSSSVSNSSGHSMVVDAPNSHGL